MCKYKPNFIIFLIAVSLGISFLSGFSLAIYAMRGEKLTKQELEIKIAGLKGKFKAYESLLQIASTPTYLFINKYLDLAEELTKSQEELKLLNQESDGKMCNIPPMR